MDILKTSLNKMDGEGSEDDKLRSFLESFRRTPSMVLEGKSPFEMMTGRKMPSRLDILSAPAAKRQAVSQQGLNMTEKFNKHHGAVSRSFALRKPIFYQLQQNNVWYWRPGTIVNKLGAANYLVLVDGRHIKAHANQLKHRFDREFDIYGSLTNDQCISQTTNVLDEAPPQCALAPEDIPSDVDPASDNDPLWAEDDDPADQDEEIP